MWQPLCRCLPLPPGVGTSRAAGHWNGPGGGKKCRAHPSSGDLRLVGCALAGGLLEQAAEIAQYPVPAGTVGGWSEVKALGRLAIWESRKFQNLFVTVIECVDGGDEPLSVLGRNDEIIFDVVVWVEWRFIEKGGLRRQFSAKPAR